MALAVGAIVAASYIGRVLFGGPFWFTTVCRIGDVSGSLALVTYKTLNVPTPIDPGGSFWESGAVVYDEWWGWKRRLWFSDHIDGGQMSEFAKLFCEKSSVNDAGLAYFPVHSPAIASGNAPSIDDTLWNKRLSEKRAAFGDGLVVGRADAAHFFYNIVDGWGPPSLEAHDERELGKIDRWFTTTVEVRVGEVLAEQRAPVWFEGYFDACISDDVTGGQLPAFSEPRWARQGCEPVAWRKLSSRDFGDTWTLHSCGLLPAAEDRLGGEVKLTGCEVGLDLEKWRIDRGR